MRQLASVLSVLALGAGALLVPGLVGDPGTAVSAAQQTPPAPQRPRPGQPLLPAEDEPPRPGRPAEPPAGESPSLLSGQAELAAGQFVGPGACASANCHGNAEATSTYDVLQNEFTTWFYQDPHRQAFDLLYNDESRLIARNMRLERQPWAAKVCLDCHALSVPAARQARRLELEDGISCEACHGPAGGWLARHNESGWTHEDSVAAGLLPLESLEVRAGLCLSCHLGDRDQQVDHELIAAGHPELVFELDNYSEAMPPHWVPGRESHGLRAWAAGQGHAFQEGLEQLARRAESGRWPEFAEMSCDACHHDLSQASEWRQVRGYRYRAGLPPWSPARYVVLRHLVSQFAPQERATLDAEVARLDRVVAIAAK